MKKAEAIKLIDNLYYAVYKLRSNIRETANESDPHISDIIFTNLFPELFIDDTKLTVLSAITKAKEISDKDIVEPITIYNLINLIDRKFPELRLYAPLIGFNIPAPSISLIQPFEE